MPKPIIVGDVGGTNVRLAVAQLDSDGHFALSNIGRRPVDQFGSLELALQDWLEEVDVKPMHGVFALAGPTGADEVRFTNSEWVVSASKVRKTFGFDSVDLVNDFAAQAMAIPVTPPQDFTELKSGNAKKDAPIVVLGPGTGLGLAALIKCKCSTDWEVLPTEGGHQAFAPKNEIERKILNYLIGEMPVVSFEHVLSGPGLLRIYQAIGAIRNKPTPLSSPPEVGEAASNNSCPLAVEAAKCLALILASFSSNAVLSLGALGGCVIAGGVAEQLAKFLATDDFVTRFTNIGPMQHFIDPVPVRRNKDQFAALRGAAAFAPI